MKVEKYDFEIINLGRETESMISIMSQSLSDVLPSAEDAATEEETVARAQVVSSTGVRSTLFGSSGVGPGRSAYYLPD